jgi:hypothetical protein
VFRVTIEPVSPGAREEPLAVTDETAWFVQVIDATSRPPGLFGPRDGH